MTQSFDPKSFATSLIAAHNSLKPLELNDIGDGPQTLDDVYEVQRQVMGKIGPAGAFKTAYPEAGAKQIMAPIPERHVRASGVRFERNEMRLYGIEIEIAFRVERELPSANDVNFEAALRDAVSVVPVIEMVDSRIADQEAMSPLTKLADNQSNLGLVYGEPVRDWHELDLATPSVDFLVNGQQTGPTKGLVPGGVSAFEVLKGFAAIVGDHCGGVRVGQYVTCGAISGLHWTEPGADITGRIDGVGSVSVTIGS